MRVRFHPVELWDVWNEKESKSIRPSNPTRRQVRCIFRPHPQVFVEVFDHNSPTTHPKPSLNPLTPSLASNRYPIPLAHPLNDMVSIRVSSRWLV
jgi:hypothetical protein